MSKISNFATIKWKNLDRRAVPMIMVGCTSKTFHKVFNAEKNEIMHLRHAVFNETYFPEYYYSDETRSTSDEHKESLMHMKYSPIQKVRKKTFSGN